MKKTGANELQPKWQLLRLVGLIGGICTLHIVLVYGWFDAAVPVLATSVAVSLFILFLTGASGKELGVLAIVLLLLLIMMFVIEFGYSAANRVIVLPPIAINAWLAFFFGRTLLPGRQPLISRISEISRGELPAKLLAYTRHLTVIWTAYFLIMLLIAVFAGIFASPSLWSWLVNVAGPFGAITLFLVEHAFRSIRFRELGHNSPWRTLRIMLQADTWRRL